MYILRDFCTISRIFLAKGEYSLYVSFCKGEINFLAKQVLLELTVLLLALCLPYTTSLSKTFCFLIGKIVHYAQGRRMYHSRRV